VRAAIEGAIDRIVFYPEREPQGLKQALAELWGIEPELVMLGNGATDLLHFVARTATPRHITLAEPTFSEFHRAWPRAHTVAWHDFDLWPREGLFVLTQPNNPTGETVPFERLRDYLLATEHPVMVDESFIDFSHEPSCVAVVRERPNLIVLRSLTKFYALPGLRIGAMALSPDIAGALAERREPWQVNVLAEAAALAAIADKEHAARSREFVCAESARVRERLGRIADAEPVPGDANFVFVRLTRGSSADLCAWMLDRKMILRDCTGTRGIAGECVRFAIRTAAGNDRLLDAWEEYQCGA
jgi:threonine-phosphate decarboxylase